MTVQIPDLLTIAEAAELLRIPVDTLRYWRQRGIGPDSFKVGRHVMYRAEAIADWLALQEAAGRR
jgi:excisionase family DNA binding protein